MAKNDGGAAFPISLSDEMRLQMLEGGDRGKGALKITFGMSLRDWFAGTIPVINEVNPSAFFGEKDDLNLKQIAKIEAGWRYMLADAMLKEREKDNSE